MSGLKIGGDRQFVTILATIAEDGLEAVNVACELALEANETGNDSYRLKETQPIRARRPQNQGASPHEFLSGPAQFYVITPALVSMIIDTCCRALYRN